jgi:pilus assembly protein CpaF
MNNKSLTEAFDVKKTKAIITGISDYEIFPDKTLLEDLRTKIIENIIDKEIPKGQDIQEFVNEVIDASLEGYDLTNLERSHIFNLIDDEINGYGPISQLLLDKNITEIMVNGPEEVYIEIDGKLIKDDSVSFINDEHIIRTVQRLIQPLGRTIDANNPMVDSRLENGARINAIIPPLSVSGPVVTIRKFKANMSFVEDLIRQGTLTTEMANFLECAVLGKLNIIIAGGTGSGKTTLLNVLSSFIPNDERLITIEDAAELRLEHEHLISLETRTTNYEKEGEVTIRDLVRNALRMRPDRIVVGEVRGKEAFDMMQAMNTGHEGSLTTLHANSGNDALNRLETMILMNNMELPIKAIREYIISAIDLVINIERLSDGKRKITSISEISGTEDEKIVLKEIFSFVQIGLTDSGEVNGYFVKHNFIPEVARKILAKGVVQIKEIY